MIYIYSLNYTTHDYQSFRGFTSMGFSNQLILLLISTLLVTNLISINVKCEVVSDSLDYHESSGKINLLDYDDLKIKVFIKPSDSILYWIFSLP